MSLRNIGIIAHIDAGKTTLSERILFYTDKIHRMGEVHEGAATMDFMPEEQDRGITIASACTTCEWNGATINLIDTPGHVDFTMEVERSLRVLDGAVGVFCAVAGVEPQSETVWRQSEKFAVPKLAFVNKMDRPGASFAGAIEAIQRRLGANPVAVTVPLGEGEAFSGVLDLVTMERVAFDPADQGRSVTRTPFTPEDAETAAPWREKLLEAASDEDDTILELFLAGEAVPAESLRAAVRAGTLARRMVPVFAGSALRNAGVQPLLDGVLAYLPAPEDVAPQMAEIPGTEGDPVPIPSDPAAPFSGLVFKVLMEGGRKVAFIRLYSGTLKEGMAVRNVSRGADEKVSRIFRLNAGRREQLEAASAGDIVAVQGIRSAGTGDTLATLTRPLLFEKIIPYNPVISLALEARNTEEGKKLDEALERMLAEDPTLGMVVDEGSGQRVVSGMGELHLEILLDRLSREYKLVPRAGNPQVVHRETVRRTGSGRAEFDRELGDVRHHGAVALSVAPLEREAGNRISLDPSLADWPRVYTEAATQGLSDALQCGPLGYAVQDVAVTVTALERREGVSSAPGYRMAAAMALKAVLQEAAPALLEPIMRLDLTVPESMVGAVVSLVNTRGGRVENIGEEAGLMAVHATAPMRGLFGFSTALRSATQGRAGFVLHFARFDVA